MLELHEFLQNNKTELLAMTESKTLDRAGTRPSSDQLKTGLPIFFQQLQHVLSLNRPVDKKPEKPADGTLSSKDAVSEQSLALANGKPEEAEVARSAGVHGTEYLRLGYTLSHVVHAYGAICQSITELATRKSVVITAAGFHDLNQCLDVAIAGAVTEYQNLRDTQTVNREVKNLGFLAHELRNSLSSASLALQLIKNGTVGFSGNTGRVLEESLNRMEQLIDRSLTEVRLRVDPEVNVETKQLLQIVDQILITAEVEATVKKQNIEVSISPSLNVRADQQAFHSALSNLVQNAVKYTRTGGKIKIRGSLVGKDTVIEVEDQCGGLLTDAGDDLFEPFVQKNDNRKGLGLGLTIAQRAIELNQGKIEALNLPHEGCIFKITLPL